MSDQVILAQIKLLSAITICLYKPNIFSKSDATLQYELTLQVQVNLLSFWLEEGDDLCCRSDREVQIKAEQAERLDIVVCLFGP